MSTPIDPAALAALFDDAHTAYAFTGDDVTDEELARIYELARLAPTALNCQPLRVTFARGAGKGRLIQHLAEGNRAKSQSAPVTAVLSYDIDFHESLPTLAPQSTGARERFVDDPAGREAFARMNAAMQAGYFILAARALGLDAGPMGGFDKAGMDAELHPDSALRSFLVVNLGHAAEGGTFPRNPRHEVDDAVTFVRS